MKKGEIIFCVGCIVFFGFMLFETFELLGQGRPGEVGSGLWPFAALLVCLVLSILMLLSNLRAAKSAEPSPELSPEALAEKRRARTTVGLSIACFLAYIVVMPLVGFVLATFFYILAFAFILGERRGWVLLGSPPVITAVIMGVFAKFITIPFPKGIGLFADFSRLFY
jgi:putative tricarboxylic transport membrane protein